ncbi:MULTISPECIES: nucleic acid/nucleotide deaminase domain-containing protein [Pseudomonas]|jgi:hypothetical protein|uniref:Uncharacterized protein n=1 Tax=Pseudomonas fluorescens TaxID=294 RepID=A0AAE2A9G5_PSEFL|nr:MULTISPECIES: nucleic acid/nucleotide deaminase domain-containing protein [Pseudomonas]KIF61760.1 hypothetical protein QS95_07945 [Pseudomonas fluorescens]POA37796.1 hypothetical protein C1891_11170 [Pseudomonas sp. GW456-12-1-14-TSB6]
MPYSPEKLDLIAKFSLRFMFTGTYSQTKYMNSACVAVSSDGDQIYIAANDLFSDRNGKEDILAATAAILSLPKRPTLWQKKKYRLELSKKQRFWNQIERVSYMLGLTFSIHPSKFLFIPNRKGDLDRTFHAEMQLIRYHEMAEIPLNPRYIGVSKACCLKCTGKLTQLKIRFHQSHDESESKDWVDPTQYLFPESHTFPFLMSSATDTTPAISIAPSASSAIHIEELD